MGQEEGIFRYKYAGKTRKEKRKQMRSLKKQIRDKFHLRKYFRKKHFNRNRIREVFDGNVSNSDCDIQLDATAEIKEVNQIMISKRVSALSNRCFLLKKKKLERRFERKIKKNRNEQLRNANKFEDKTIRNLEKKLNIDRHDNEKAVHKIFHDGLDYALEVCLLNNLEMMAESGDSRTSKEIDADVKLEMENGGSLQNQLVEATNAGSGPHKNAVRRLNIINADSMDSCFGTKVDNDVGNTRVIEKASSPLEESDFRFVYLQPVKQDDWEGTHGRTRNENGKMVKLKFDKYVPPHLRIKSENVFKETEKLATLQRKCKGFLNRLSEANVHRIASDIENLYRRNARFDMNSTLMNLIKEAIIKKVLMPERTILEHTLLITVLHANIGSEIGAYFLENIIIMVDKYIKDIQNIEVENKEVDNILFMLCHMYTFTLFHHSLIYGILIRLTEKFCEKSIECLLLILRTVGFQLRKDDPITLRNFILRIQKIADESPLQVNDNPRLKFMLKVLHSIKNNNLTVIPHYDPELSQHMMKILKSMMVDGKRITTLNLSIEDFLSGGQNGKWWIVGSAWNGKINETEIATHAKKLSGMRFSDQLYTLARKHRMNTNDRINIFCIIMSSEDYLYAYERLLHLSIKDHSLILAIIIHCCLAEKTFNPYYGALAQKFCEHDRKYQHGMKHVLWDRIKNIHSASKQENINLAGLLTHLIVKGYQSLSILKVIEFEKMDKDALRFVRQIMLGILLSEEDEYYKIFARIAPNLKLTVFKDSLRLFLCQFLQKGTSKRFSTEKLELLKKRINIVNEIFLMNDFEVNF